jgi:anti-sigma B factor antagonist
MSPELFQIEDEGSTRILALTLPAVIDAEIFDKLNESITSAIAGSPHASWVLDLSNVAYMGSSMLGLMVNARQTIKAAGGKLVLCGMSDRLMRVFQACCMERLFTITRSRAEAVRVVGRSRL